MLALASYKFPWLANISKKKWFVLNPPRASKKTKKKRIIRLTYPLRDLNPGLASLARVLVATGHREAAKVGYGMWYINLIAKTWLPSVRRKRFAFLVCAR